MVRENYRKARRLFVAAGDRSFSLSMKVELARIDAYLGQLQEAEKALREGIASLNERDEAPLLAVAQKGLGEVLIYSGRFREALSFLVLSEARQTTWSNPRIQSASRLLKNWARVHLGRYRDAQDAARRLLSVSREKQVQYDIGLTSLVLGCAALARGQRDEAPGHLRQSVRAFRAVDQYEELAWAHAGLGFAALHDDDVDEARKHLLEALRLVPDYQHYASALMALPAAALLFAKTGQKERCVEVYALTGKHRFVANSQLFEDVVGRRMAALTKSLPEEVATAARARGEGGELWETAEAVLQELKDMRL